MVEWEGTGRRQDADIKETGRRVGGGLDLGGYEQAFI
jgi:hypothetical protein